MAAANAAAAAGVGRARDALLFYVAVPCHWGCCGWISLVWVDMCAALIINRLGRRPWAAALLGG